MKHDKEIFSLFIIYYCFDSKKRSPKFTDFLTKLMKTYSGSALSVKTCVYWFLRFKSGDFDLKEQKTFGSTKKVRKCRIADNIR